MCQYLAQSKLYLNLRYLQIFRDFKHSPSAYTYSTFISPAGHAATGTIDGDIIIWADKNLSNLTVKLKPGKKAAIRIVRYVANKF